MSSDAFCGANTELVSTTVNNQTFYKCVCASGFSYVAADQKSCVADCGTNVPWTEIMTGTKTCASASCQDKAICDCDFYGGYYNKRGSCTYCVDSFVSEKKYCQSEAICSSTELAYGRRCITADACFT